MADPSMGWKVSQNSFGNSSYATDVLLTAVSDVFAALPVLAPSASTDQLATFNSSLSSFNEDKTMNAFNATALSAALEDLFFTAGDLSSVLDERIAVIEALFNFSAAPPVISTTTIEDERELNRVTLNQYINSLALYYDYLFVSTQTFATEEDIEDQSNILNEQFGVVVLNNTFTNVLGEKFEVLDTSTFSILQNARDVAHDYLNSLDADSKKIISIIIPRDSLLPLTFSYYSDLDNLETLYSLNNINNAGNISGQFKVLTDVDADNN